eukprot:gene44039-54726_t
MNFGPKSRIPLVKESSIDSTVSSASSTGGVISLARSGGGGMQHRDYIGRTLPRAADAEFTDTLFLQDVEMDDVETEQDGGDDMSVDWMNDLFLDDEEVETLAASVEPNPSLGLLSVLEPNSFHVTHAESCPDLRTLHAQASVPVAFPAPGSARSERDHIMHNNLNTIDYNHQHNYALLPVEYSSKQRTAELMTAVDPDIFDYSNIVLPTKHRHTEGILDEFGQSNTNVAAVS